jgi:hypothetical protein
MYYFFFSYAEITNDKNNTIRHFFDKLNEQVGIHLGKKEKIGFFATENIRSGNNWDEKIIEALNTSKVFIYLVSPAYYQSSWCSLEWQFFYTKTQIAKNKNLITEKPGLMIPIPWMKVSQRPSCESFIQFPNYNFKKNELNECELYHLFAIKSRRCETYIGKLTEDIIEYAKYNLPKLSNIPSREQISDIKTDFELLSFYNYLRNLQETDSEAAPTVDPSQPKISIPPKIPINEPQKIQKTKNNDKYYVALDLGSETMAAYFETRKSPNGKMIYLQRYAEKLLNTNNIDYVKEKKDGSISPRLRTRICLEDGRQPKELSDSHAEMEFIDTIEEYSKSLFSYFQADKLKYANIKFLPNPKIPFQNGGREIIPTVKTIDGNSVKHSPETIIQHLTTQIIINFILKSEELENASSSSIHLMLTMPNVYSLSHVESIRDFIQSHIKLASIDFIYESDAIAYFIMNRSNITVDSKDLIDFKSYIENHIQKNGKINILTMDFGKGTNDLSLIEIKSENTTRQHRVLARTGKCSGGNELNYIFVFYYYEKLLKIVDIEFSFLTQLEGSFEQYVVLRKLEILIEEIKASIDENYNIGLSPDRQSELIEDIAKLAFEMIDSHYRDKPDLLEKCSILKELMALPASLPKRLTHWQVNLIEKIGGEQFNTPNLQKERLLINLRQELENYVKNNSVDLIDQLMNIATCHLTQKNKGKYCSNKMNLTGEKIFAVIAGQASQFKPLNYALKTKLNDLKFKNGHYLFLEGPIAKEACCQGAVAYQRAMAQQMNQYEIHGTYGFLPAVAGVDDFKQVDMVKFGEGKEDIIEFKTTQEYWFVFSPRVYLTKEENPKLDKDERPFLGDGCTSLISNYKGYKFRIKYNIKDNKILISEDLGDYIETSLATYGNSNQPVYPKVWPDALIIKES